MKFLWLTFHYKPLYSIAGSAGKRQKVWRTLWQFQLRYTSQNQGFGIAESFWRGISASGILGQDCMCPVEMCGNHMASGSMAHGRWKTQLNNNNPPLFDFVQVQTNKRSGTKLPEELGKETTLLWESGDGFHLKRTKQPDKIEMSISVCRLWHLISVLSDIAMPCWITSLKQKWIINTVT